VTRPDKPAEYRLYCCQGKEAMPRRIARQVARRMKAKGKAVDWYRCPICGEHHVGQSPRQKLLSKKRAALG
jgi:hypothetical protein